MLTWYVGCQIKSDFTFRFGRKEFESAGCHVCSIYSNLNNTKATSESCRPGFIPSASSEINWPGVTTIPNSTRALANFMLHPLECDWVWVLVGVGVCVDGWVERLVLGFGR